MKEQGIGIWVKRQDAIWEWRTNISDAELKSLTTQMPYGVMDADDGERFLVPIGRPYPNTMRRMRDGAQVPFGAVASMRQSIDYDTRTSLPSVLSDYKSKRDWNEWQKEQQKWQREQDELQEKHEKVNSDFIPDPLALPERSADEKKADKRLEDGIREAMTEWFTSCEGEPDEEQRQALAESAKVFAESIVYLVYSDDIDDL